MQNSKYESRKIKWISDEFKKGALTVDNTFQRKYVWNEREQILLIETILLSYPIPEIYLWENEIDPASGDTKYSIVDGQQRITTIGKFIDGEIRLKSSVVDKKDASYANKSFGDLSTEEKKLFWAYEIPIRFLENQIDKNHIIEMFLRLNKTNNALNPQELRNAEFNGEFLKASESIANFDFWNKFDIFTDSQKRRMQDIQFSSTLLMFIQSGFEDETTQKAINDKYDLYNESYPDKQSDIAKAFNTFKLLEKIMPNEDAALSIAKKPTHLYTLFNIANYIFENQVNINGIQEKINKWYLAYSSDNDKDPILEHIDRYKALSNEGVSKKSNRSERFNLIKNYLNI